MGLNVETALVVSNETDGKHIFGGIPGHRPFKVEEDCASNGRAPGQTKKLFKLKGGLAMDSKEYMFAIRLVINDQCGLHIETLQL